MPFISQVYMEGESSEKKIEKLIKRYIKNNIYKLKSNSKILIIPPDASRKNSGAGLITSLLYKNLADEFRIKIMPALGTHHKMTEKEIDDMFGTKIPKEAFIVHNWRKDTVTLGEVPADFLSKVSQGKFNEEIKVKINENLLNDDFALVISIGQVVPHEVVGMANYTKNIVVGVGGKEIINKSHYLGAVSGLEKIIGKDHSPVRKLFDYIEDNFLNKVPLHYILSVNETYSNKNLGFSAFKGIFIGEDRKTFEKAVELSQDENVFYLDKPVDKFIVYLDEKKFKSTWLGCKGVYRTRKAVKDGGEVILIAPGLKAFGEDSHFNNLIQKYGYHGQSRVIKYVDNNQELKDNLAVAAHLIHGSSEGRFNITVATDFISKKLLESVNYNHLSMDEAKKKYSLNKLKPGYNIINNNKYYYIEDPASGLWVSKAKF